MTISARVHYACLAMVELASQVETGVPVTIREISEQHNIPGPFLVQILRTLRSMGWVESIRGSQGGYTLIVAPERLTVLDIADAVGCQEMGCKVDAKPSTEGEMLKDLWIEASQAARDSLASTRLIDLVVRAKGSDSVMFYI